VPERENGAEIGPVSRVGTASGDCL